MFTREIKLGRLSFQVHNRTVLVAVLCVFTLVMSVVGGVTGSDGAAAQRAKPPLAAGYHYDDAPSRPAEALRDSVREGLDDLYYKQSPGDPFYFLDGIWKNGKEPCARCNLGPAVAAAALGKVESDERLVRMAIRTIEPAIRQHRMPNGGFGPAGPGEGGIDIQTSFFALHLGLTLYILGPELGERRRERWTEALRGATEFLVANGNYAWYTNGNIVLANAAVAALTWHATGDARYRTVFEEGLEFAMRPPADRWGGHGLVITKEPSRADGADGAGYLTESPLNGNRGFDADYTQVQADIAATLAIITDNPDALRLTNLMINQIMPRVDRKTWQLDTSGGSRHPAPNRTVPFTTGALTVLSARGRGDLRKLVDPQSRAMAVYTLADHNSGGYHQWGSRLAPALITLR